MLDNVKFKKNNFQNRNRFLNKSGNEEWFTVRVEKKANSRYGLSSYKLWNALNSIAEKGAEWNIDGFRGSNTMDALFANMGPNIASLAKATDEAERVNQPT